MSALCGYTIHHVSGKELYVADALSRATKGQTKQDRDVEKKKKLCRICPCHNELATRHQ